MVMLRHREKVLAHAEQELASRGKSSPSELLSLYKKFLRIEDHRLRLEHYAGGGGLEIAQKRATLIDIVLRHLFETGWATGMAGETEPPKLALVAIGGYGRGELNPYSDVDIMFLHSPGNKKTDSQLREVIQLILYMLWDVGFKVGHSTRTIDGAIKQANEDMLSKTSLLESRHIAGDKPLLDSFREEFVKRCVRGFESEYIAQRVQNQAERHAKYGGSVYMQEPNIKNGCGSLRDYQNLMWISYFKERLSSTRQIVEKKLLLESERRKLDAAYDFLLRVRTELHYLNKRASDVLSLVYQLQVANKLNYPQRSILRRSEAFMRDYYQHARNIYYITESLAGRLCLSQPNQGERGGILSFLKLKKQKQEEFDAFFSADGLIYPTSRVIFSQDPPRLMRLFQHAQQRNLDLSSETEQLVRRGLRLVDRTFQYARAMRESFETILSQKGKVGRILRMMHRVDFLGRYVPEFGELTCLVQHEFFHRYTADEHTLVCIDKLDQLVATKEQKLVGYQEIFQKLEDPFVLYLALLLHDTGKASNAKYHAEASALFAQRVSARLQLSAERRRQLIFLVDNHMALSSTAQRRNLEDAATIKEFAGVVKDQSNLDALMLLTLVDGLGVGDDTWSDWKESLVWDLYHSTSQYLANDEEFYRERRVQRENLQKTVRRKLSTDYEEEIEAHFNDMPELYFQSYKPEEIVGHLKHFREFLAGLQKDEAFLKPVVHWVPHPEEGHSEVWICTWDREQLLAKIAASFSVLQLNILGADIFTRKDDLVLDIFRVCDTNFQPVTDPKEMAKVEDILTESLKTTEFDFNPMLAKAKKRRTNHLAQELDFPTRISIDNAPHPNYTLVDIQAPDRIGLLYTILKAFGAGGFNIVLSRIATEKGAAIDSFYVTTADGKKVKDRASFEMLERTLKQAAGVQSA